MSQELKPVVIQAEIQYMTTKGWAHSDLSTDIATLHEALDEWYRRKTGYFYVGDPEVLEEYFSEG
jgi:Uma2 family endonuclease